MIKNDLPGTTEGSNHGGEGGQRRGGYASKDVSGVESREASGRDAGDAGEQRRWVAGSSGEAAETEAAMKKLNAAATQDERSNGAKMSAAAATLAELEVREEEGRRDNNQGQGSWAGNGLGFFLNL
ncbi:hypothetical protein PIB30_054832 [Stylosanthes scabra]|uniref:Uncharacterized protein n=1 Tax=Stylosanthes scabra TaxID=79078 RepID=A0ABU6QKQ4_9FABA|nr:hypothetical protein [Stylosanthes scabra]